METVLRREELTTDTLRKVFDAAFMQTALDSRGHLMIRDGYPCWVVPEADGSRVHILAYCGVQADSTDEARLRLANRVNDSLALLRAAVTADGSLLFDTYVVTNGGVPARSLVTSVKTFDDLLKLVPPLDKERVMA